MRTRLKGARLVFFALAVGATLSGAACGAAFRLAPEAPPNDTSIWRAELGGLASRLFTALRTGRFDPVLVPLRDLDRLLTPSGRIAVERERESLPSSLAAARAGWAWGKVRYTGFCAQDVHPVPAGSAFGLRAEAWAVERVLVVVTNEGERTRSAAWVDGRFFRSNRGWVALSIGRIERPRGHHTDLEVARCDVEAGIR